MDLAQLHFGIVEADPSASDTTKDLNRAVLAIAHGDWELAHSTLAALLERDPENAVVANNLAVSLWAHDADGAKLKSLSLEITHKTQSTMAKVVNQAMPAWSRRAGPSSNHPHGDCAFRCGATASRCWAPPSVLPWHGRSIASAVCVGTLASSVAFATMICLRRWHVLCCG